MKKISTNTYTNLLLLVVLCILIEGMIFGNGMITFALLGCILVYFSFKKQKRTMLWCGIIFLLISIFSMWSLRLLLIVLVIYILWKLYKGEPIHINFEAFKINDQVNSHKSKNKFFQFDDIPSETYIWKDIHLQNFVGEVNIDATETILPKGTSFISIRQGFGKMTIAIPYEIPVRVHFNTIVGEATIIKESYPKLWNESIAIKNGYSENDIPPRELIITVSSFLGDLEVIRK